MTRVWPSTTFPLLVVICRRKICRRCSGFDCAAEKADSVKSLAFSNFTEDKWYVQFERARQPKICRSPSGLPGHVRDALVGLTMPHTREGFRGWLSAGVHLATVLKLCCCCFPKSGPRCKPIILCEGCLVV